MMGANGGARWSIVQLSLGMCLVAAGTADGHDLVVSGRDADWALLGRADFELLSGFWLPSGRFSRLARLATIGFFGGILIYDLTQCVRGHAPHHVFGRLDVGPTWVLVSDLVIVAASLCWQPAPEPAGTTRRFHPGQLVMASLVAAAIGVAIDRSQVGQFPIIATVSSGRTQSGLDYLVYTPRGYYRALRRWPLVLTLHGQGEAGNDVEHLRHQPLAQLAEGKGGLPFFIVAPQSGSWTWNVEALSSVLDEVLNRYRVDADRVYVVGNSMGGNGTWELAAHSPERFAAIAPICGRGDPSLAGRLKGVPTWAFHGADDRIVPLEQSERMIAALKAAGGDARLTVYPGVGHDAWTPTFANPKFYEWLLQHKRGATYQARRDHD
jgi:predicted esterase